MPGALYLIDTINPVSWFRAYRKIFSFKPDIIVLQWWNPFFAPVYLTIACLNKIFTRSTLLFICHNVYPHEKLPFKRWLTGITLRLGHCYLVQSIEDGEKLKWLVQEAKYMVTPHPTYSVFKWQGIEKSEARAKLRLAADQKVLVYFGFVRAYKGLIYLIRALPAVKSENPNIKLLIAGEFFQDKKIYTNEIEKLELIDSVIIYDKYIPDREVEVFFAAADLVVLPYISATQSGIAQIAFGFQKPVIVTAVVGLLEVVTNRETGYVVKPEDPEEIAAATKDYYKESREIYFTENIGKSQVVFSWDRLIKKIEELCPVNEKKSQL